MVSFTHPPLYPRLPSRVPNENEVLHTYLLTPWSSVLLEKLTVSQLVKKFPPFYGTRRLITAFTSARHLSLSWARSIQSIPLHPTSWRSILILSFHLRLGLPSDLFPSGFPTRALYTPLLFPIRGTCPAHVILLVMKSCYQIQFQICPVVSNITKYGYDLPINLSMKHPRWCINHKYIQGCW